jgi:hypothetical protein
MGLRDRAHVCLHAEQAVAGRPFTDPAATAEDCSILAVLQATLKRAAGGDRRPGARSFADEVGRHHVVVPDWTALATARPAAMVGFFGQARDDVDHAAIIALEHDIVGRATSFSGLLAYHNAQLASGQWGNLVVFRSPAGTAAMTADPVHTAAVARTPQHYRSLRLHRGVLADGCLGAAQAHVEETLYLDFGETPTWRALRAYA